MAARMTRSAACFTVAWSSRSSRWHGGSAVTPGGGPWPPWLLALAARTRLILLADAPAVTRPPAPLPQRAAVALPRAAVAALPRRLPPRARRPRDGVVHG